MTSKEREEIRARIMVEIEEAIAQDWNRAVDLGRTLTNMRTQEARERTTRDEP